MQVPPDVARLVVAARIVAFEDQGPEAMKELDEASEAFADRVPWDDDPNDVSVPTPPNSAPDERMDAIADRAQKAVKALEVGGMAGAFLCVQPLADDIPWLLAQHRALMQENERLKERAALFGEDIRISTDKISSLTAQLERLKTAAQEVVSSTYIGQFDIALARLKRALAQATTEKGEG